MSSKVIKSRALSLQNLAALYASRLWAEENNTTSGQLDQGCRKDSSKNVKCIE